jgi:hypothetical protein
MKTPSLLLRWELFIGGGLDGQILGLHHVHAGSGELAWDRFLPFGELLIATGAAGVGTGHDEATHGSASAPGLTASQRPTVS